MDSMSSARRNVRFVLDGQLAVSVSAQLSRSSQQSQQQQQLQQAGGSSSSSSSSSSSRGKASVSRKRSVRPSLPNTSMALDDEDGDGETAEGDHSAAMRQSADNSATPQHQQHSSSASPSLLASSEWSRPAAPQPDVVSVRADLANIALPSSAAVGSASNTSSPSSAAAASASASAPSLPPPLHPSSLSLAQPQLSAASSAVAPLSSQLLGSMLNLSAAGGVVHATGDSAAADAASASSSSSVDVNQWPYSGPQLGRARLKSAFPAIIPSSARWFDPASIAAVERRAFPDWLHGGVGRHAAAAAQRVEWYRQIRNGIVAAYRANPRVFLTVTACRRHIAADVGAISRIHTFLQQVHTLSPTLTATHAALVQHSLTHCLIHSLSVCLLTLLPPACLLVWLLSAV